MVCDNGVVRRATAERREVDTTRDAMYDRRDGRLVVRQGRVFLEGERC